MVVPGPDPAGRADHPLAFDGQSQFHTTATANLAELTASPWSSPASTSSTPPTLRPRRWLRSGGTSSPPWLERRPRPFPGPPKGWKGRTPGASRRPGGRHERRRRPRLPPRHRLRDGCAALCAALVEEARGKDWLTAFPGLAAYPPQMFEAPPAK
uniref:Uncharacterized protein n=1 Tax=Phenylobacterium glaciei TaxID=2803784 RepID=A0A974P7C4_9CAUL|nr:hypothetical protein JKL49_12860 [Phenylobacterium glaciei]